MSQNLRHPALLVWIGVGFEYHVAYEAGGPGPGGGRHLGGAWGPLGVLLAALEPLLAALGALFVEFG